MNQVTLIIVAIIAAAAPLTTVISGMVQKRKLDEIHVMVNGRLDAALAEVAELRELLSWLEPKRSRE